MNAAFSVVRFSPDPEEIEFVNVGIFLWGDRPRLVFDPTFQKLACVAPHADHGMLGLSLTTLASSLGDCKPEEAVPRARSLSAQFQVTAPRHIFTSASSDSVEAALKTKYLVKPPHRHAPDYSPRQTGIERRVDAYVQSTLNVKSGRLMRKARPSSFLSAQLLMKHPVHDFVVARVINGLKSLVLLDGLDLTRSASYLQTHASKIARTYYWMRGVAADVEQIEGRSVLCATLLFGENSTDDTKFVVDLARKYSTHLEYESSPDSRFRKKIESAADALFA